MSSVGSYFADIGTTFVSFNTAQLDQPIDPAVLHDQWLAHSNASPLLALAGVLPEGLRLPGHDARIGQAQ